MPLNDGTSPSSAEPRSFTSRCPTIRRACMSRARRPMSTTSASPRARCISPIGMADKAAGALRSLDLDAVRSGAGRRRGADRRRHSRQERRRAGLRRRAAVRRRGDPVPRPGLVRRGRDERATPARRAARLAQNRHRGDQAGDHHRRRAADGRARPGRTIPTVAATPTPPSPARRTSWRASSQIGGQEHFYLEGQVSLAVPGEGIEMTVHASTQDPTRNAAYRRPHSRHSRRVGHRRDAAHGRRLRRQGEPGRAWAAIAALGARKTGPPVQGPARPRRRLHADRQAPRFPRRLARRLRRRAADRGLRRRFSTRAAAVRPTCHAGVVDRAMFHADNAYYLPDGASSRAG